MKNKSLITTFSILALAGTIFVAVPTKVSAFDGDFRENGLVQRLLERFGLNQDDVEEVVNEYRQERQGEMQQRHQERVNQLITEESLTQEQASALNAKHEEWQNNKPDYSQMSQEERQEARDTHRQEMQEWAQGQGIDLPNLNMRGKGGMGRGSYK